MVANGFTTARQSYNKPSTMPNKRRSFLLLAWPRCTHGSQSSGCDVDVFRFSGRIRVAQGGTQQAQIRSVCSVCSSPEHLNKLNTATPVITCEHRTVFRPIPTRKTEHALDSAISRTGCGSTGLGFWSRHLWSHSQRLYLTSMVSPTRRESGTPFLCHSAIGAAMYDCTIVIA